ncbi:MAG: hypothetical protein Q8M40_12465 [Legionella sp.]|nr:hypothetical protein [Legionella sp.]
MPKRIKFNKNAAITEIWDIYSKISAKAQLEPSIQLHPEPRQDWSYTFGLTDQKCFIDGVVVPQLGGLSTTFVERMAKNPTQDEKDNLNFFNYVYNQCHLYIADNQTRYIGRADLKEITHGKVFAMTLLAHLCQAGMDNTLSEQEKYKQRIIDFTKELLNNENIKKTSSNDGGTISCKSALNNIYRYNASLVNAQKDEKDLDKFFEAVNKTVVTAQTTFSHVNDLLSQFTTHKYPQNLQFNEFGNNTNRTLSNQESAALNDPLAKEMFGRMEDINKTENGYKELYQGIDYKLPAINSFLLSQFNVKQIKNLKEILQLRDKLFVLSTELSTVYNSANSDRVATRSEFLPLIDSYLKDINRVKTELHACIEKLDIDCDAVYRSRKNQGILDNGRTKWESQFLNKNSIEGFRTKTIELTRDIASAFSQISFNHFDSLKKVSVDTNIMQERGKALFGNFISISHNFQQTIAQAQTNELSRQAEIIVLRLKQLSVDNTDLINQAESMGSRDEPLIKLLKNRKTILDEMIKSMQNQPLIEKQDKPENDFVLIENDNSSTEIINAYSSGNLLQFIQAKLMGVPVENQKLQENNHALTKENHVLIKENSELKTQLTTLQEELKKQEISSKQQLTESEAKVKFYESMPDDLSAKSKTFLGSVAKNLKAKDAEEVKTIITNFERIVNQGMEYKDTYINKAGNFDKTLFFSHNNNGKKNASKVMGQWKKDLDKELEQVITMFKGENVVWNDETINAFKETLENTLKQSMKNLIVNETYSSYTQYSFRNYLHQFYQNVFPENKADVLADKLEKREVKFNVVPQFKEQTLRDFEKTLQPEPQAQMRM